MGIFDTLFGVAGTDNERLADRVFAHMAMSELGGMAADKMWTTNDERLTSENLQLDALMKRRALGLPQDTGDLEDAMNNGLSFRSKGVLAMFGSKASSMIPDPSFLKPKLSGNIASKLEPVYKTARLWKGNDDIPSILGRGALGILRRRA